MTANVTPRLGLMSPVDTDPFTTEDFEATFGKLDDTPGNTLVSNFNSLPTNWTTAQHGSTVLQRDNGALWMWRKPSSAAGVFIRLNNLGLLASTGAGPVTTTTSSNAITVRSASLVVPGGRTIRLHGHSDQVLMTSSDARVGLYVNGALSRVYTEYNNSGALGLGVSFEAFYTPPTPNTSTTFSLAIWSRNGGTVSIYAPALEVYEV